MDPTRFGYQKVFAELVGEWRCIGNLVEERSDINQNTIKYKA
jgi:hypothetical protein